VAGQGEGRPTIPPGRGRSELIVFGRRAVRAALESDGVETRSVSVARQAGDAFRKELTRRCRELAVPLEVAPAEQISALSREPRHDQGVVARVGLQALMEVEGFVDRTKGRAARRPARLLALDGITNSQNIGMIVRSVVASGMDGLLWPMVGSPWINGLVVKSSASTVFDCPILRCERLADGLHALRRGGFRVVGLTAGAARDLRHYDPPHRAVFVVGGETQGLAEEIVSLLDDEVRIPMQRGVESLNVAVAASLLCFQVADHGPD